jgi:hypothetical protein
LFQPQVKSRPASSAAAVCRQPPLMSTMRRSFSASTALGVVWLLRVHTGARTGSAKGPASEEHSIAGLKL